CSLRIYGGVVVELVVVFICVERHTPSAGFYSLSLHDALPIFEYAAVPHAIERIGGGDHCGWLGRRLTTRSQRGHGDNSLDGVWRSEEHTSELQSRGHLVCRLLLEKKNHRVIRKIPRTNPTEHP